MWLNERARQTGGAGYECAGVTLGGSQVETVASAHLRETPVYAPYGYAANVPAGAQVLLLSGGEVAVRLGGSAARTAQWLPALVWATPIWRPARWNCVAPAARWCACAGTVRCV